MTFESMFKQIHGYDPFPWQYEAARQMVANKTDSLTIKVPTAAGKTALIDAAVYAAAHGGPKKIVFIIDRRVVVDEAYARAKRIAEGLQKEGLKALSQITGLIRVVRLRGGVHNDDEWVLYPEGTTIIVSTVDQIGSRLLHRGYGVSSRMAPMHAGFVGKDAVYIIDEAHLSVPFIETVQACRQYGAHIGLVTMTATPVMAADREIELSDEDRNNPTLSRRLKASKKVSLMTADLSENAFVKQIVDAASQMAESIQLVGVMVNRVATARAIWQGLLRNKKNNKIEAVLLTGRNRTLKRDELIKQIFPKVRAGRSRGKTLKMVVVSTQTLEVGADIDFDGLITEAASLDALRQRFGRLDRLGELGLTRGIVFYRQAKKDKAPDPDPIYGMAIHETWLWLNAVAENGHVDFGVAAMETAMQKLAPPAGTLTHAPALLPTHIKLLSQTGPFAPRIDVAPWLHGAQKASADVSIIWRADLDPNNLDQFEAIKLRPPLTDEALAMPIYAVRAWLQGKRPKDVTDLEGILISEPPADSQKPVVRWRGPEDIKLIQSNAIAPGDTIIVPSEYGACDEFGWAPDDKTPVEDVADFCSLQRQTNHTVRLVPGLTSWLNDKEALVLETANEVREAETAIDEEIGIDQERVDAAHFALREIIKTVDHPLIAALKNENYVIELHPKGVVLRARTIDDFKGTNMTGVAVALSNHLDDTAKMAARICNGHPESEKIIRTALTHDEGKKETRFQSMLHGNPISASGGPLLAKSGFKKLSQKNAAYEQSGLPKGFRHELASLEILNDPDAVVNYLIATHHGYGRPWFSACEDPNALGVKYSYPANGWLKVFASLQKLYGPWVLADMELHVRAADIRQSMAEQEGK